MLAGVARSLSRPLRTRLLPAAAASAHPLASPRFVAGGRAYGGDSTNFTVLDGKLNTSSTEYAENMSLMDSL